MALAAGIGLELDLRAVPTATGDVTDLALLFAETPSRLMLAIDPAHRESFEQLLSQGNVPWAVVGRFSGTGAAARLRVVGRAGTSVIDLGLAELRQHYTEALHGL